MPREPLSNVDTAWLRMEDPTQPMMITIVMVFGPPLDAQRLRVTFQDRLLRFRRFRQRVVQPARSTGRPYWEDDPGFDLDFHLQPISLQPPGDEAAFRDLVSQLISTPLDFSRPLWHFHLIEGYGEGWALVGRVHHCLADGPALLRVLACIAGDDCHEPWQTDNQKEVQAPRDRSLTGAALEATVGATDTLTREVAKIWSNPLHLLSLARLGAGSASALNRLLFRSPDPPTVFKGPLGFAKRAAWSAPIALADVKAVGRATRATVNDVMLAATSGALRRYLQSRGEPVDGLTIRTGLSVNLRSPEAEPGLGNQAGALLVPLPIGTAHPLVRLSEVKRSMDTLKNSPEGTMIFGLLNALGMAPADIQDALVETYCTRDTAMMANVPGPRETIHLAGAPLELLLFWVPALGGVGLNLNVVSYAGQIRLGVATDRGLVPDPETIVSGFHAEFEALLRSMPGLGSDQAGAALGDGSIEAMSASLDKALATLDSLLEDSERDGWSKGAD